MGAQRDSEVIFGILGYFHIVTKKTPFHLTARHLTLRGLRSVFPQVIGISSALKKITRNFDFSIFSDIFHKSDDDLGKSY